MMHKVKISYIVQSCVAMGAYILLAVIVSMKFASAEQLSLATKIAILGFLWVCPIYGAYLLVRSYKKLDDYDLDSNDKAPWSIGSDQLSLPQSNIKNIFWGIIFLAGAIVASWGMVSYVKDIFKASSAKDWPTAMAVVVSSKAVRGCGNGKSYYPEVLYKYKVGLTSYVGNRLAFGVGECVTEKNEAQATASQYPVEMAVMVHFNPEMPSEAVIIAGQVPKDTWWAILALPFMIIGVAFVSWSFLRHVRFR